MSAVQQGSISLPFHQQGSKEVINFPVTDIQGFKSA